MAYTAHEWKSGDTITAERLNALENGVQNEQVGPAGKDGAAGAKGDTGATGKAGADGKSVKAIALTIDTDGKVTGGTATLSDNSTLAITVTNAS
jgi:hypothetical protein